MGRKKRSKALGKGIYALIKNKTNSTGLTPNRKVGYDTINRNIEFYGSLLKKYVEGGGKDPLIEQLLSDTREHLGISKEEHLRLLKTFRKRGKELRMGKSDENWDKVQKDMREELTHLFEEFKSTNEGEKEGLKEKKTPWKEKDEKREIIEEPGALAMPGHTSRPKKERKKKVKPKRVKKHLKRDGEPSFKRTKEGMGEDEIRIVDEKSKSKPLEAPPSEEEKEILETGGFKKEQLGVLVNSDNEIEILEKRRIRDKDTGKGKPDKSVIPEDTISTEAERDTEIQPEKEVEVETQKETPKEEVEEEAPEKIKRIEDSLTSLRYLMEEGEIQEAVAMSERLLENEPYDTSILNERGVLLYNRGDMDEAIKCYEKALHIDPESSETLINYGVILAGKGKIDESIKNLDKALDSDPYSEDAWNNKAVVLSHAGRNREALECLDESLRINEDSPETWLNAGIVLERMGEYGPALECYQNVLKYDPENVQAHEGIKYCRGVIE